MDFERTARIARNRNHRQQDEFPLFAPQIEPITSEQVQAAFDRHAASFEQCSLELQARGDDFRARVAALVSAQDLAALDDRRSRLPISSEYHADFWRYRLHELLAAKPPPGPEPPCQKDLFGSPIRESPRSSVKSKRLQSEPKSRKWARSEWTLFDFPPVDYTPAPPPATEPAPVETDVVTPQRPAPKPQFSSGEKAKARDVLEAIRVLKAVEADYRPATDEEKRILARFAGFGPVALSIFPDPVSGRYKDDSWQDLGQQLRSLLTQEEYESAARTTFNAFYTSPSVISAMHGTVARLGVPGTALTLEPGCGTGNFMSFAPPAMRFVGVELDSISGRIARARHPGQDIRIESFRDTQLPEESLDCGATVESHGSDGVTVGDRTVNREEAVGVLGDFLASVPHNVRSERRIPLGTFRGLRFGLVLHPQFTPEAYLDGATGCRAMLSREHHGPRAILNALDRLAGEYRSECNRLRQQLTVAEGRLRDYQARTGAAFPHEGFWTELGKVRDEIKSLLSGPPNGHMHDAAEITERFRSLKPAHIVEAAPERIARRRLEAEEPVTARIRRRIETALAEPVAREATCPSPLEKEPLL